MDNPGSGSGLPSPDASSLEDLAVPGGGSAVSSSSTPSAAQLSALSQLTGGGTTGVGDGAGADGAGGLPTETPTEAPAREVGTVVEELVTRPLEDIGTGLTEIFSLHRLLGIENPSDTPEQKAKKQQLNQRFNQLTGEEQAVADERFQRAAARKQQLAEEAAIREQQAAAQAQSLPVPSGPNRGFPDAGHSRQQAAAQQLEQDRKASLSKLQSAG